VKLFTGQETQVLLTLEGGQRGIDEVIFNRSEENIKFMQATQPVYEEIIQQQGDVALLDVGMDFAFNLLNPMVTNWIAEKEMRFADVVNTTTQKQLRVALIEGIQEGENIESLKKRVQGVFDGTVRGSAWRSRMIARTEVIGSFNFASLQGYQQSGVVTQKEWLTALDERVRQSHRDANGQIRKLDEPFDVGGSPLMFPGDGEHGSMVEVINCRCTLLPLLE